MNYLDDESINCDACGFEYSKDELKSVRVKPFRQIMKVCSNCLSKTAAEAYKDAADILLDVKKITKDDSTPEQRLKKIQDLIG
jgi:hypothetical protein